MGLHMSASLEVLNSHLIIRRTRTALVCNPRGQTSRQNRLHFYQWLSGWSSNQDIVNTREALGSSQREAETGKELKLERGRGTEFVFHLNSFA